MTNDYERKIFSLYKRLKLFLFNLIKTKGSVAEDQLNTYKSLRTDYSEFKEFFQPKQYKDKRLFGLLVRFMRFIHFALSIYKEEDLDNFSSLLFTRILGIEFAKDEFTNGLIELKTYLWANEIERLLIFNNTESLDQEIINDTLTTHFPNEKLIYTNNPTIDSKIHEAILHRKEDLLNASVEIKDLISPLIKGKRLRKSWKPALKMCPNIFDNLFNEIKNGSSSITDEQPNTVQYTEEEFEDNSSIPNNQQQLNTKQKGKKPTSVNINKISISIQEESPSPSPPPQSSSSTSQLRSRPPPQLSPSSSITSSSKRKVSEAGLSDEEPSDQQTTNDKTINNVPGPSNVVRRPREAPTKGKIRRKKYWSTEETKALENGLAKFGEPRWTAIKNLYSDVLADRESMDLRDKARNMIKHLRSCNKDLGVYKVVLQHDFYSNI